MLYHVTHTITYTYSAPVFLEPHIVHLRPRCDASQNIRSFSMIIEPEPAGIHDYLDAEGNCATCLWFEDKVSSFTVSTSFDVETLCINPFGYLVTDDSFFQLPVSYSKEHSLPLSPFLADIDDAAVLEFAREVNHQIQGKTIDFLAHLCTTIYNNFTLEIRDKGSPLPPSETIEKKRGACRDLALLYIAACRSVGLASRFVSGYQEGDPDMEHADLHAWAEVYIPGGGWRGYDPTHGLAVADRHIVLAASCTPAGASPVSGTLRGTGVTGDIDYRVTISHLS